MSILYGSSFNYPEPEFTPEFIDPNHYYMQSKQNNPSLAGYCSAPISFFESLVNCSNVNANVNAGVVNLDDLCYNDQTMSPEIDTFYSISHEFVEKSIKQEETESSQQEQNQSSLVGSFGGMSSSMPMESTLNGSSLVRQKSTPAVFFSNIGIDNDVGNFTVTACNGTKEKSTGPSTSRFNNDLNNFGHNSASLFGLKRAREDDVNMFSNPDSSLGIQNGNSRHCSNGLSHHLSLTKNSPELATTEKFLHFQNSNNIPCKLRAKRGFATHPRSIAERERRTRISERMRKLQDLFPNIDKQATTAEMLDMAVEFIKDLQNKVQTLTDTKARCICGSKQRQ